MPLKAQMAYFFEICETFCRKNEAQNRQVEKIGIPAKNSEDYVKSRVTFDLCYHGTLIGTFIFRLKTFLASER